MLRDYRLRAIGLLALLALASCATPAPAPTPPAPTAPPTATPAPTSAPTATAVPSPTPEPQLAAGVLVAGVDVGGKTASQAGALLEAELSDVQKPIELSVGDEQLTLRAEEIGLVIDLPKMLSAAADAPSGARIPLAVSVDRTLLEARLAELAEQVDQPAVARLITSTKTLSRSFALDGGRALDVAAAADLIEERLQSPGAPRRITLRLSEVPASAARPDPQELQAAIEGLAAKWNGVVGVYVYDLESGQVIAQLNQDSVFSGASVMKVPIMLNAYLNIEKFSKAHETWLRMMIVDSDNYSANSLLASAAGGTGTDDALAGTLAMSKMLKEELGLQHTYQNMPYESSDYLIKVRGVKIKRGPPIEGPPPHTDADPVLRTTPAEMSSIFLMIEQCRLGTGPLLEKFPQLTAARCAEMISRLEKNGDKIRMRSGLPKDAVVAHKSGWIEDMQSDVGIVRSPGGDFLIAIYVYRDIRPTKVFLTDDVAAPMIGHFARLAYTYYNPVRAP